MDEKRLDADTDEDCGEAPTSFGQAISRRNLLAGVGAVGAALASGVGATANAGEHQHSGQVNAEALAVVENCAASANKCLAHCLETFQGGDTSLAKCAKKVNEMMSICQDFAHQVANNSAYADSLAPICRQACEDCEALCRKQEDKHAECKDCADACAQVVAAIEKM